MGMPHTSYTYYESKFKEPNLPMALAKGLARIFAARGIPETEVLKLAGIAADAGTGQIVAAETYKDQDMADIDELDIRGSAGSGSIIDEAGRPPKIYEWRVPRELVRAATYATPDKLKIITVVGDSMEPTFRPYERIMVDTSDTIPSPPGIFAVYDGLGLVVKRVEHIAHSDPPRVRISSDNAHYAPYERILGEAYIQGRVLGRWQWV